MLRTAEAIRQAMLHTVNYLNGVCVNVMIWSRGLLSTYVADTQARILTITGLGHLRARCQNCDVQ